MLGGGYGTPQLGFMVGAWIDWIKVGPVSDSQLQGILFGGVAFYGLQVTYSAFQAQELGHIDPHGNFGDPKGGSDGYMYRPGADTAEYAVDTVIDAFSFYHESGASLVVMRSEDSTGSTYVSDLRAQLQPLKPWLEERFGLPMIAVQQLDGSRGLGEGRSDAAQTVTRPDTLVLVAPQELAKRGKQAHIKATSPSAKSNNQAINKHLLTAIIANSNLSMLIIIGSAFVGVFGVLSSVFYSGEVPYAIAIGIVWIVAWTLVGGTQRFWLGRYYGKWTNGCSEWGRRGRMAV
jgi:hypothetical protein